MTMIRSKSLSLDTVFHSISEPILICDSVPRILQVNEAFSALFSDSGVQVTGKSCRDVFGERDGEWLEACFKEVFRTGQAQSWDASLPLFDGRRGNFEITISPILVNGEPIERAIGQAHDISRRKTLEKELEASQERYRTIVETAREGIYIVDSEGKFSFANKRMAAMLGLQLSEIIGKHTFDFMDAAAEALWQTKFERRRMGHSDTYELSLIRKDGRPIHCLVSAVPMMAEGVFQGALGIITNITCLKEIEAALHSANSFSEKIINSITDELAVIDPVTYRIVRANQSFLAKRGAGSATEATGKACYDVLFCRGFPCHEAGILCPVRKTYLSGEPFLCDTIHPDLRERGRIKQIATYPILDSEGKVELVIRAERDVTEKKELEQALAVRSEELLRTQRRLEELFELSREVGAKGTLAELAHFLMEFTTKFLPGCEPALLLLNASCDQFLRFEDCEPKTTERLLQALHKLELCTLSSEFILQLKKLKLKEVISSGHNPKAFPLLKIIAESDPVWFGIPLFVRRHCIGILFLGSRTFHRRPPPEDLRFLEALCEQSSGHLRNLVMHEAEVKQLRSQVTERSCYGDIIGQSKAMQEIYELVDLVSGSDATVLITGENGTGKEMVAHAIHRQSHRRKGPFIVANCSAYSPTLLESEIFGHEKGAFTGAAHQKKGRIERAHGGTLFLDEIGEIAPSVQIFLLRFLQDHCFERVGGEKVIAADVRVLAATNRDLQREVHAGRFRDDLFYRLNVIAIRLPSLSERKEDIPLLAQHFLNKYNLKERKSIQSFSSGAMQALMDYEWPGNVRQLENAVSHAVVLSLGEVIRRKHLPRFLWDISGSASLTSLTENERLVVLRMLQETNWNKHDAARRLKISRSTLYSKIRRYGLHDPSAVSGGGR